MTYLKNVIFMTAALIAGAWNRANCQSTGPVVGDLPVAVGEDILSILVTGTVQLTGNCSDINATQVNYCLFTKDDPNNYTIITSPDQINGSKPVIVLIHGWGGNCDINYISVIKDAYLARYDANIISVDYSDLANSSYQTSYCHVPAIGSNVSQFVCNISTTHNISMGSIHVVGHSLGGQVAGAAGKDTQATCGSLGRITALDPAGPLYQYISTADRLDKTDAQFVDVIHTNEGEFGYIGDCGRVDFFPNCGYLQPGCPLLTVNGSTTVSDIANVPLDFIRCNHQRSCYLFAESINNNSFYSTSCTGCGTYACRNDILFPSHAYMGESCRSAPRSSDYYLKTNDKSPYGIGPQGPLN